MPKPSAVGPRQVRHDEQQSDGRGLEERRSSCSSCTAAALLCLLTAATPACPPRAALKGHIGSGDAPGASPGDGCWLCHTSLRCEQQVLLRGTSETRASPSAQRLNPAASPTSASEGHDPASRLETGLKLRWFLSFIDKPCRCCGRTHGSTRKDDLSWVQGSLLRKRTLRLSSYTQHNPHPLPVVTAKILLTPFSPAPFTPLSCSLTSVMLTGPKESFQVSPAPETALI